MIRRLPPGTLRRLRIKWLALGVLLGAGSCAALAMYAAAIMPPELAYRSAARNVAPLPPAPLARGPMVELPPCAVRDKDCETAAEPAPSAAWREPWPVFVPLPDAGQARAVPAPGTLSLLALAACALLAVRRGRRP
ncbi:PEP-CTERM sorting domain-containing protein [Thauera sp.]|uniref:PEP-CTERM sorting domain-containing protein n=1 Tax=Thauera sp. TaxID=1905334 RepID=UPI0039E685F0